MKTARFLNVDLDLRAKSGLKKLIKAFGDDVCVLYETDKFAVLEVAKQPKSIDEAIKCYHKIIQKLPPRACAIWNKCKSRTFNIGIQSAEKPHQIEFQLSGKSLSQIHSIKGDVAFTVYAPEKKKAAKRR